MTAQETVSGVSNGYRFPILAAFWIAFASYLALVVAFGWNSTPPALVLATIGILLACVHAALYYGWEDALALFSICVVITFAVENVGSATGLPFGHYHFEVGAGLPHIGLIPIIVGPLWFGMGYFSWIVAGALLGTGARPNGKFELLVWPVVAAFVMTQWDVVMDPPMSTISKAWIWHDGGAHFGVPLPNYAGWLLTAWLFCQAFAILLDQTREVSRTAAEPAAFERTLRLVAILLYLGSGLTHLTPWLTGDNGEVMDAAHHVWRVSDLRGSTVVTMTFTIFFTSLLAMLRLATERNVA